MVTLGDLGNALGLIRFSILSLMLGFIFNFLQQVTKKPQQMVLHLCHEMEDCSTFFS